MKTSTPKKITIKCKSLSNFKKVLKKISLKNVKKKTALIFYRVMLILLNQLEFFNQHIPVNGITNLADNILHYTELENIV